MTHAITSDVLTISVSAATISDIDTIQVGSGSRFGRVGVRDDTEAVTKSAITLYANFIYFVFNELISV